MNIKINGLDKIDVCFMTPHAGYLSVICDECEIKYEKDSSITIKNALNKLFLDKDVIVCLHSGTNIKKIEFEPIK